MPLSLLTTDWLALCLTSAGYAVASIETYKTFLTGRPPGKFAGHPIRHHRPLLRRFLAGAHAGLWTAFATGLTITLAHPVHGLTAPSVRAAGRWMPAALLAVVAIAATSLAVSVAVLNCVGHTAIGEP